MSRPLRVRHADALYHITARGNARGDIYLDDADRRWFLGLLEQATQIHHWNCHAYCLMSNHYHLLIETAARGLSKGMRFLNGHYAQMFNRRHRRVGHVLQGRYKAILVQKDSYLLEVARYIVLNPVRARMVSDPGAWPWSSFATTAGHARPPPYLTTDWILGGFGSERTDAQRRYVEFVMQGIHRPSIWQELKNQIFLGDESFVARMQSLVDSTRPLKDVPRAQRLAPPRPLPWFAEHFASRNEAMAQAYLSGHYTHHAIAEHFKVSSTTVRRAVTHYRALPVIHGEWRT